MPFENRMQAGRALARALVRFQDQPCTVLALPRGGVPVAAEVAAVLRAPLDLILVRKVGVPFQPELAMGAVVDGLAPIVVRNEDVIAQLRVSEAEFQAVCASELREIERRRKRYLGSRTPADIADRVALVIDDGIATGATIQAALRAVRKRNPRTLVLAVPVAPTDTIARLRPEVDEIVCLEAYDNFGAIGMFYDDFSQVTDGEVIDCLARCPPVDPRTASSGKRGAPSA